MMRFARPVAGGWVARELAQKETKLTPVGDRSSVSAPATPQTPARAGSCESVLLHLNAPTPTPTHAAATELTPAKESSAASSVAETESLMGDAVEHELADTEYFGVKYNRRFHVFLDVEGAPISSLSGDDGELRSVFVKFEQHLWAALQGKPDKSKDSGLNRNPTFMKLKQAVEAVHGKRTRNMTRNLTQDGKYVDPNVPISVPIGTGEIEIVPSRRHLLLRYTPGMFGLLHAAITADAESVSNPCTDTPFAIQSAFGPDDKKLMKDFNIKFWPSKRVLICDDPDDNTERRIHIQVSQKRRRKYSEAKFEAYVQTKAQAALKKAVRIAQGQAPRPMEAASDASDVGDESESPYVNSSAED